MSSYELSHKSLKDFACPYDMLIPFSQRGFLQFFNSVINLPIRIFPMVSSLIGKSATLAKQYGEIKSIISFLGTE